MLTSTRYSPSSSRRQPKAPSAGTSPPSSQQTPLTSNPGATQLTSLLNTETPSNSPMGSRKRKAPGSSTVAATATTSEGAYGDPGGSTELNEEPSEAPLSPVAKKGRTNTPWTPAEERRLKSMRDAGSSWNEIAKVCIAFDLQVQ